MKITLSVIIRTRLFLLLMLTVEVVGFVQTTCAHGLRGMVERLLLELKEEEEEEKEEEMEVKKEDGGEGRRE